MKSISIVPKNKCCGCAACTAVCPTSAISMNIEEGFYYPKIDDDKCILCGKCTSVCPCLEHPKTAKITNAYISVAQNRSIYKKSSSGGVFGVLADYFIREQHGVVCGAALIENLEVKHIFADRLQEIHKMQGSKYVQSSTIDVFTRSKEILESGRKLLFSGTPCQVAALRKFIGKDYNNLFCVDIVCHGVPSPELFRNHILGNITKGKQVKCLSFRTKDKYDRYGFNLKIEDVDGKIHLIPGSIDPFYRLFLKCVSFREACYSCPYAKDMRLGDLTIGDCGNSNKYIDFHPSETISTIYPITDKGRELWDRVMNQFDVRVVDSATEIRANAQLNYPAVRPESRTGLYPCSADEIKWKADDALGRVVFKIKMKEKFKRIIPEIIRKKLLTAVKRVR